MKVLIDLDNITREVTEVFHDKGATVTNLMHSMSHRIDQCVLEIKFELSLPAHPSYPKEYRIEPICELTDVIYNGLFVVFESYKSYIGKIDANQYELHGDYYIDVRTEDAITDESTQTTMTKKIIKVVRSTKRFDFEAIENDLVKIVNHIIEIMKK